MEKTHLRAPRWLYDDELFHRLSEEPRIPQLLCPADREAVSICVDPSCHENFAICCRSAACVACRNRHEECFFFEANGLSALLNKSKRQMNGLLLGLVAAESDHFSKVCAAFRAAIEECGERPAVGLPEPTS